MNFNDFSIKEVNAYYDRLGGIRTASIKNYANVRCFSNLMQRAAAQAIQAAQETQSTQKTAQAHGHTTAQQNTQIGTSPISKKGDSTSPSSNVDNGNICCEKCHATEQLLLEMMSRNLYAQSALNYPLAGSSTLTAYQNMANILGRNLF